MSKITKEIVLKVKGYEKKHPDLSHREIAVLCGIGATSVGSIKKGMYDHLFLEKPTEDCEAEDHVAEVGKMAEEKGEDHIPEVKNMVRTEIPYEAFKELVVCKYVIGEIFANMKKSTADKDALFIEYKILSKILKRDLPEMYDARMKELSEVKVCTRI